MKQSSHSRRWLGKTKYNAVVGFHTNVVDYSSNITSVVAAGTLVSIKKEYSPSLRRAYLSEKSYMLITIMTSLFQEL